MEIITLSGKVVSSSEIMTDRNGNQYIRFMVSCARDSNRRKSYNIYRCFTYDMNFRTLAEGDTVFLSGDVNYHIKNDETGKPYICNDVFIKNIAKA